MRLKWMGGREGTGWGHKETEPMRKWEEVEGND